MESLVVTSFTPNKHSGRGNRTIGVIRALALLGRVEVAYLRLDGSEPDPTLLADPAIELRKVSSSRGAKRAFLYRRARARGVPKEYASSLSCELFAELTETKDKNFDRVVADSPSAATALLLQGKKRPIYYNAHNLESALQSGRKNWSASDLDELAIFERLLLETAQETWLPSSRDLSGAAKLAPEARLRLVPNVVDVSSIAPVRAPGSQSALFVADFSLAHNRRSAHFLVAEVMPQVWKRLPQARLVLAGRRLAESDYSIEALSRRLAD